MKNLNENEKKIALEIAARLKKFHGINNPVKSYNIASKMNINAVTLRKIINSLRMHCHPIGSGVKGYWYAHKVEDIIPVINDLKNRMRGINNALKGLTEWVNRENILERVKK